MLSCMGSTGCRNGGALLEAHSFFSKMMLHVRQMSSSRKLRASSGGNCCCESDPPPADVRGRFPSSPDGAGDASKSMACVLYRPSQSTSILLMTRLFWLDTTMWDSMSCSIASGALIMAPTSGGKVR